MKSKLAAFGVALIYLLGGCAIHPQPKDVTGISTFDIVQQIRCETRQAVIHLALEWLTSTSKQVDAPSRELGLQIANEYAANPDSITKLNPKLFKGEVYKIFNLFWTTGIAYNYNLDMTEINNTEWTVNFGKIFTN
jgi:hypothetical protein